MDKREETARRLCFDRCSAGEFIDPENGCVSKCFNWRFCTTWRHFLDRVAEGSSDG